MPSRVVGGQPNQPYSVDAIHPVLTFSNLDYPSRVYFKGDQDRGYRYVSYCYLDSDTFLSLLLISFPSVGFSESTVAETLFISKRDFCRHDLFLILPPYSCSEPTSYPAYPRLHILWNDRISLEKTPYFIGVVLS